MEDHRATKAAPATTTITYSGQKNKINKKKFESQLQFEAFVVVSWRSPSFY